MEETWVKLNYTEHDSMLVRTFATFFEKQDYLDVTFVCKGGKKVLASKLVLSCLSPFLKSLLSEWKGDQEMITLLLPEVDHIILKLIFDFVYEGVTKLSEVEFKGFKEILQLLEIRLPGSTVIEPNVQSVPPNPPPPLAKLQKKPHVIKEKKSDTENETETKENPSAAEDTPVRRANDPDYDPLDVPDFYYVPSTLTGQTATNSKQGSNNVTDQQTGNTSRPTKNAKRDLNKEGRQQGKGDDKSRQGGKNTGTRKRTHPQKDSGNPDAKRSSGRKIPGREREDGMDSSGSSRKRNRPQTSSESENSLEVPAGTEQNKRGPGRRQSFTYMREDSMDFMVNDMVTPQRSKSKKT